MTTQVERMHAVVATRIFLVRLLDSKKTPDVPSAVRHKASALLRHYPLQMEIEEAFEPDCRAAKPGR